MKKLNWDKELKKVQKRGLYNPKVRVFSIIAVALLTLGIGLTFSAFSYSSGDVQAFNSTVTKKVNVTINATNGIINKDNGHILAGTLSAKILENNTVKTNPTFSSSHTDNGLYVQKGDNTKSIDGKPTYYFRGTVTNNFVSFAGMTWRIVRINEDGTIRLISSSEYYGGAYNSTANGSYNNSSLKQRVDNWYNGISDSNKNYIATAKFCNDTTNTASSRLSTNPTFVCPSGANELMLKVGVITADELRYSGSAINEDGVTFIDNGWNWTMTQANSSQMYIVHGKAVWNGSESNITSGMRSHRYVINLKAEALYKSGDGTSSNPYRVEGLANTADTYIKESKYNQTNEIYINPYNDYIYESASCDNGQTATYDNNTHKLTINPKKDTTCTVKFKQDTLAARIKNDSNLKTTTPDFSTYPDEANTGLFTAEDEDGTSYYYRGNIHNNYVDIGTTYSEDVEFYIIGVNGTKVCADSRQSDAESRCNRDYSSYGYDTAAACIADIQDLSVQAGETLLWRVVRLNGDGSVRLISDNLVSRQHFNSTYTGHKYVGYTYDNGTISSTIKTYLDNWYTTNIANKGLDSIIQTGTYCNDTSMSSTSNSTTNYYGGMKRINDKTPSLKCPQTVQTFGGKFVLKVGLISADELMMAGYSPSNYKSQASYISNIDEFWTGTPYFSQGSYASIYSGYYEGNFGGDVANHVFGVRPVINLKADTLITAGDGTKNNPYVIN